MKTYDVKLIRQVSQTVVVRVEAENGIAAVDVAIANKGRDLRDWQTEGEPETFYREVKEVPEEKCKTTVIHGYKVELELFEEDGEPRSDCSVTRTIRGTEYGGSLGMLMGFGSLEAYETGDEYAVADTHRDAIVKWAEANGY